MDDATLRTLVDTAQAWRDDDPDPRTRAELDRVLAAVGEGSEAAVTDLADRFAGTLQFGTAGLRGALGAGPNRMNRAVVIRTAAGLVAWLHDHVPGVPRIVVGFDARHDSDVFARDTCAVAVAAGCVAMVLPRPLPTPVLAFAVRYLGADAGVMVTASHNPPQDNGYKVYLGGRAAAGPGRGVQIVPPADEQIAAAIAAVGPVLEVPLADDGWDTLDDGVLDDYLDRAVSIVAPRELRRCSIVLTPLHGVGGDTVARALRAAGFGEPYLVPEQAAPDPDFPTVAFPNPEEPGALDPALAAARGRGADLVIANDPDADRCAVAVPDPAADGGWRALRGDELGWLLAEHILSVGVPHANELDGEAATVACSIVSSQLLARIAAAHRVRHVETLTGFKWIARTPGLVFGYEEALGYCVAPHLVRDKDGVTAALLVAEFVAGLLTSGRTVLGALDALARAHGVHVTDQLSVRVADLALIADAMARLRQAPPAALGGAPVTGVDDLLRPQTGLPPTDGLRLRTADGVRVVVRPSGTEPKLKCYLEAVVPIPPDAPDADLAAARALARDRLDAVRTDLAELIGP
jgi:phosphomannomutase